MRAVSLAALPNAVKVLPLSSTLGNNRLSVAFFTSAASWPLTLVSGYSEQLLPDSASNFMVLTSFGVRLYLSRLAESFLAHLSSCLVNNCVCRVHKRVRHRHHDV